MQAVLATFLWLLYPAGNAWVNVAHRGFGLDPSYIAGQVSFEIHDAANLGAGPIKEPLAGQSLTLRAKVTFAAAPPSGKIACTVALLPVGAVPGTPHNWTALQTLDGAKTEFVFDTNTSLTTGAYHLAVTYRTWNASDALQSAGHLVDSRIDGIGLNTRVKVLPATTIPADKVLINAVYAYDEFWSWVAKGFSPPVLVTSADPELSAEVTFQDLSEATYAGQTLGGSFEVRQLGTDLAWTVPFGGPAVVVDDAEASYRFFANLPAGAGPGLYWATARITLQPTTGTTAAAQGGTVILAVHQPKPPPPAP